ncbi:ABC transporter permease [Acidobacteriota bacterium]
MIKFIFKGIIRDRSRSLFPILTVFFGVMLTVLFFCYIGGAEQNFFDSSAKFDTGHVKITSRAYAENADQMPNDLAYMGVAELIQDLKRDFPNYIWTPRIRFGGLFDVPDDLGETSSQGPVFGLAVDLLSSESKEKEILNLEVAVVRGRLPEKPGEILLSDDFALKLEIQPGQTATVISSTMYGSMATANFTVVGTVRFGITMMDRGAMIADISDIQTALDMEDTSGEILGFNNDFVYSEEETDAIAAQFNSKYTVVEDEFSPVMKTLHSHEGLAEILAMVQSYFGVFVFIFILVMSIVLWNAGLIGSLRRYGEIGVRLAIGEHKGHLYRSLIFESMMIGCIGTVLGTAVGLALSYWMQTKGINIGSMMQNSSMMLNEVLRAKVTAASFVIGFIPGLLATFLGTAISGIGIYKRQTSQLMKELEV